MGRQWNNWSGALSAQPRHWLEPASADELAGMVRSADGKVRVAGSGHSFTALVPSDDAIVSLDRMSGIESHDAALFQATVLAGTQLGALTRMLDAIGQALPNMGDIDKQTLGGALGTATHGTGPALGAYHTQLAALELVDGRGTIQHHGRDQSGEGMIEAIGVVLGAFGIVTRATITNVAPYKLHKQRITLPIQVMLDNFETMMTRHRSAEFYYIPLSGHALFLACDITDAPVTQRPPENDEDGLRTLRLLRDWLGWFPAARRKLIASAIAKVPGEDYVEAWLKVYTSERTTRFNEMEYHLPVEEGPKALREIIALTEARFPDVFFPMEVRTVAADDFWLSPFYRRQTCSIAVHHDAPRDPKPFFSAIEPIFRKYGGRPHWGKMHSLTSADFEKLYPRWKDAMDVRRSLDPDRKFVTPYIARLIGDA